MLEITGARVMLLLQRNPRQERMVKEEGKEEGKEGEKETNLGGGRGVSSSRSKSTKREREREGTEAGKYWALLHESGKRGERTGVWQRGRGERWWCGGGGMRFPRHQ
jgi:hypothetical protein